jgi:ribonuclease VapC
MVILDASAILAYLHSEPGWQAVESGILNANAHASPVNIAEVASKLIDRGVPPDDALSSIAILKLTLLPFAAPEAAETARLRPLTQPRGLSLGDRACLATGWKAIDRAETLKASEKQAPSSAPCFLRKGKIASTMRTEPQA